MQVELKLTNIIAHFQKGQVCATSGAEADRPDLGADGNAGNFAQGLWFWRRLTEDNSQKNEIKEILSPEKQEAKKKR